MEDQKTVDGRHARQKAFAEWNIEKELPAHIGSYSLERVDEQDGRVYKAFRWKDKKSGWEIRAVFDEETADYMIKVDLKFITCTQVEVITPDFERFKKNVRGLTPDMIEKELIRRSCNSVLIKNSGFVNWNYEKLLPPRIENYERVIEPKSPINGLNGSYIIAAYQCNERETAMLFFYNVYREEYYGEMRSKGIPIIRHEYDAKTVNELAKEISENLQKDLHELYERS